MKASRTLILICAGIAAISTTWQKAAADTFGSGANTFDVDFVQIGNPGNPADNPFGPYLFGSVPYSYRIGTYEISRSMVLKANAAAGLGITLQNMTPYGGNGPDKPATGISWNEAARFINWLNTTSGSTPAYKFAIQPGGAGYDANADIQTWSPGEVGFNPNNLYRNSRARYVLPSSDEWYKAAYYDPTSGAYFEYPTGSNSPPAAVASGTAAGTAVYGQPEEAGPADIMHAGGLSSYGTMAQGANVYEWNETDLDLVNGPVLDQRVFLGGLWSSNVNNLLPIVRGSSNPSGEKFYGGFRIASVPEPNTLTLTVLAIVVLASRRRPRR